MLDSLIGSFGYLEMLDYLIEDNNLKDVLRQEGISDKDILFIKEMIAGPMSSKTGNQCCKLLSTFHSSLDGEYISNLDCIQYLRFAHETRRIIEWQ